MNAFLPRQPRPGQSLVASGFVAVALVATALLAIPADVSAATKKKSGKSPAAVGDTVYRCRGPNGQQLLGQAIPAECMESDVEVLDESGRVMRVIPGRKTLEQQNQQKADAAAIAASQQRDRTLLATYLSVADIERLRDSRIEQLEQQNVVTQQYIANLRSRETRLMAQVQRFRPYNEKPNAPPLPEQIANEIVNTVKGLQVYEQELAKNTTERDRLKAEFAADIQRFKELKNIR